MALNVATGLPAQNYPLIDDKKNILPVWYQALLVLQNRTGGQTGTNVDDVKQTADDALVAAGAALTIAAAAQTSADASAKKAANLSDLTDKDAAIGPDGLNLGPTAQSATVTGWPASTDGSRVAVDGSFTQTATGAYSQANTQDLIDQVKILSQALAQLINDQTTFKTIGP
jgi:hypothetical protein